MQEAIDEIGLDWAVGIRNGDTDPKVRQQQVKNMPDVLVATPERPAPASGTKRSSAIL